MVVASLKNTVKSLREADTSNRNYGRMLTFQVKRDFMMHVKCPVAFITEHFSFKLA